MLCSQLLLEIVCEVRHLLLEVLAACDKLLVEVVHVCFGLFVVAGYCLSDIGYVCLDVLDIGLDNLCNFLAECCDHFLFEVCYCCDCVLCVDGFVAVI